ncbi:hypothetical protein ACYATM_01075 [Lactobacillaceae bacterium Scapto_B20]
MVSEQFIKINRDDYQQLDNLVEVTILSLFKDLLKSSQHNERFYDPKLKKFFVAYTNVKLRRRIHCGKKTCTKAIQELSNRGLITIQPKPMHENHYFISQNPSTNDESFFKMPLRILDDLNNLTDCYALALIEEQTQLSKQHHHMFVDDYGQLYIVLRIKDFCQILKCSYDTCRNSLKRLENAGYIRRIRQKHQATRVYLLSHKT